MNWAIHDGDVPVMEALRGGGTEVRGRMATDPIRLHGGSMNQGPLRKEDATASPLATMRQAGKRTEKGGDALSKKPRDLPPLCLKCRRRTRS